MSIHTPLERGHAGPGTRRSVAEAPLPVPGRAPTPTSDGPPVGAAVSPTTGRDAARDGDSGGNSGGREWRLIAAGFVVYLTAVTVLLVLDGYFPTVDLLAIAFLPIALVLRRGKTFVADWVPFAVLLLAYEEFRGLAFQWEGRVHVQDIANLESWLFGSPIPTVRLQQWLYTPGQVGPVDVFATGLYFLHFVGVLGLAFWLWIRRDRRTYWRYILAVLVLSYAGFATYALFPAMPPRLATAEGAVPPLTDIFAYTVGHFALYKPFFTVYQLIDSNPYAAMPSLHIAYPMLVFLAARRVWPARWTWLVALYPLAMTFSVVYLGHHYLIDCVAGILYAEVCFWLVWDAPAVFRRPLFRRLSRSLAPARDDVITDDDVMLDPVRAEVGRPRR